MRIFLFLLLLGAIALLSRPGLISRHPVTGHILGKIQNLILQRALALLLMLPALITQTANFPSWVLFTKSSVWSIGIISILVPFLAFLLTRADKSNTQRLLYAGLQDRRWRWIAYLLITSMYMVSYEFLLRGTLLHSLTTWLEPVFAISINTLIYSVMHIVKNKREALLSIPLGILLCWLTLYTQSVWPAAFFHSIMALSFEFFYSRKRNHVD
ncbi:MAG TPA: CPBP family intramembrane glutamic endopeptidase [Saprospiraceae bacterium]|nr:CPBP family intramembrane glutamic endopeptidase [Saprospiraceae bacterium]